MRCICVRTKVWLIFAFGISCFLGGSPLLQAESKSWHWTIPTLSTEQQGAKVEVRWTRPVRRSSAPDKSELAHYWVHFGPVSRGNVHEPSAFQYKSAFKVTADQEAVVLDGFPPGQPYYVAVTAVDADGRESPFSSEGSLTVASPLIAKFSFKPRAGEAPLTVMFSDVSEGGHTSRTWAFGDRRTSSAANPRHTFQKPGTYRVRLSIKGLQGSDETEQTIIVSPRKRSTKQSTKGAPKPSTVARQPARLKTDNRSRPKAKLKAVQGAEVKKPVQMAAKPNGQPGAGASSPSTTAPARQSESEAPEQQVLLPPARSQVARLDPSVGATSRLAGASQGKRRGAYNFRIRPEDYGYTYVGAGDHRAVQKVGLDGDWFEDQAGGVFHVTWVPSSVTPEQEMAYIEKSVWRAWHDVHPRLNVYLVRGQTNPTPIAARDGVGSLLHYTAHVTGAKRSVDYAIRVAVFRETAQTYACILSTPIGGSIYNRQQKRVLKQREQEAAEFFKVVMDSFRPGPIPSGAAQGPLYQGDQQATALISAAKKGDTNGMRGLLGQGVDAHAEGQLSITPLMVAAGYGHVDTVRALLQAGAQVNARAQWGATALIAAALNGHADVVRELEEAGATQN